LWEKLLNKIFLILSVSLLLVGLGNTSFAQFDDKLAVLETNLGTIVIEFFPDDAPNHVENFIGLTESGFYDGVLFHRIIPGFMIQGGDPNTIDGDPNTWGTGGPTTSVDAEFNTIKHNRGIVSMARSADPNSGGSQFFIVHANSNFLDEQYTVFGRIVTEESFETLDKIIAVEIGTSDRPIDPEQVKITKATTVNRSEISNLLELDEPIRTESTITPTTSSGNQIYENKALDIVFTAPEGWLLQQPEKISPISPDIRIVGPIVDGFNPNITLTISNINEKTIDDLITEKNELLSQATNVGLELLSQEKITINEKQAYVTIATQNFEINNKLLEIKFKEVMIVIKNNSYIFAYGNIVDNFDNEISKFNESVNSFKILSEKESLIESTEESGGCLIATATFGSELAPQVQQLRELRDNTILSTESGTAFMSGFNQFYYSFSPVIADMERENSLFKEAVKLLLTPMLSSLSILNYVDIDSEEEMLSYGIGIILMNVGMYFAAPAIIIYKIRK
jgi:peptidyl-prolyl cis-trans isomerase B (cyclophilin B)